MAKQKERTNENIPAAEWVAAGVGALLVAATLIVLIADALNGEREEAQITFSVDTVIASKAGYLAKVTADNAGKATAAALVIEGVLTGAGDAEMERSEIVLDYLPGRSRRPITLIFTRDPRVHRLTIRARGYQDP